MSKKLTIDDIKHLADLSALKFSDEELESFLPEFNNILDMINQIENFEVNGEYVFDNIVDITELREDEVKPSMSQEKALINAPKQRKGCFNVPKVVE
jgi:aspartyl-tRNA(Asn)/glutamyl-tRNA(Gln) amidotransferase subunit C